MLFSPEQFASTIQTLSFGVQLSLSPSTTTSTEDLVTYHRKLLRATLKTSVNTFQAPKSPLTSLHTVNFIFLDAYRVGADSLKYHATQFVEMFRDALMRPGHRLESHEKTWPALQSVRIVMRGGTEDEVRGFGEVKEEVERIGEGKPRFCVVLEDDENN